MVLNQLPLKPEMDYRLMVEYSPQPVAQHTIDGIFTYASPSYDRLMGYETGELLGHSIYEFIHPLDVNRVRSAYVQGRSKAEPHMILYRARRKDNQYIWLEMIYKPDPTSATMLAFGHDASKVKYLEEALRILARGTDTLHGLDFFRALVSQVSAALHMPFVFITEHIEDKTKVRMLAFWQGSNFGNPFEYNLVGTPCDDVINKGKSCYYPIGVQAIFPKDRDLVSLEAQGYIGIPVYDSHEEIIGHLAVLDSKPMAVEDRELNILRIFAARAGVELERLHREGEQRRTA
jgi:two-component system, sensor histidine kinase and response regulator